MIPFRKMNGLGNDFAVIDARSAPVQLAPERIARLADRREGIGFDQLILLERADAGDAFIRIINADGSPSEACGNATRCVAALLLAETGNGRAVIDSAAGLLSAWAEGDGLIAVDMGVPHFGAEAIPLAVGAGDPARVVFPEPDLAVLGAAACVNVGNPHAVFFVDDPDAVPLEDVGPLLERHRFFPERANISFARITDAGRVRVRVWERGAGATQACGTAACAVAAVGYKMGRLADAVAVGLRADA